MSAESTVDCVTGRLVGSGKGIQAVDYYRCDENVALGLTRIAKGVRGRALGAVTMRP